MTPRDWFQGGSPERDETIRERFLDTYEKMKDRSAGNFMSAPRDALAAVILFDQLPRNMFRGTGRAFESDALARTIARRAVDSGFDDGMNESEKQFLYMPFMRSEDSADQDRSVELFATLANKEALNFAIQHRQLIARFGRFPHRNAALGRTPTDAEEGVELGKDW